MKRTSEEHIHKYHSMFYDEICRVKFTNDAHAPHTRRCAASPASAVPRWRVAFCAFAEQPQALWRYAASRDLISLQRGCTPKMPQIIRL